MSGGKARVSCAVASRAISGGALGACCLRDPLISDSGSSHLLIRRSMLCHLAHLYTPASLPHLAFTLPDGGTLWARDGGFLRFPLHPPPIPVYVCEDVDLHHNLVGVAP